MPVTSALVAIYIYFQFRADKCVNKQCQNHSAKPLSEMKSKQNFLCQTESEIEIFLELVKVN